MSVGRYRFANLSWYERLEQLLDDVRMIAWSCLAQSGTLFEGNRNEVVEALGTLFEGNCNDWRT